MSRLTLKMVALCISFTFAVASPGADKKDAKGHDKGGAHWTYAGESGPAKWGDLEEDFAECKLGHNQAPIDIPDASARKANLPTLRLEYKPTPARIIDNGHTIQVNVDPGNTFSVGDNSYQLLQFHFHKPSEEKINGKAHAMVAHLVHRAADGKLAVVAVLLDNGKDNPALKQVFASFPKQRDKEAPLKDPIDLVKLLPSDTGYYSFTGSLTTPPCSESVAWFVLKTPSTVSADSLAKFGKIYPMNARPVQPLNGREIMATQ